MGMLQVLFLAGLASAVPAPEADPLLYTGHPLTYAVPYVTYHAPKCETEFEEVKGQSCVTKPETEADPQVLVGAVPAVVPYHTCENKVTEVCYPVQKVETTTITEKSCLLKGEVECTEVVVATIPKVTCTHEEHTKPADDAAAVETE